MASASAAPQPVVVHAVSRRPVPALGPDKGVTAEQDSKFSKKDADALPNYEAMLERVANFLEADPSPDDAPNVLHLVISRTCG